MIQITDSINRITSRKGNRPRTGDALPHLQFTENSPKDIYDELAEWLFSLKYVEERPTIISVAGARAAWITDSYEGINTSVLQFGREWTHIHPPMDDEHGGSLHLTLERDDCDAVISKGWGEYHPMDPVAFPGKEFGHILIYAPRTKEELEVLKTIIMTSYKLTTNQ